MGCRCKDSREEKEVHQKLWYAKQKNRDQMGYLGIDEKIVLKYP
jgi:hypothetical protein